MDAGYYRIRSIYEGVLCQRCGLQHRHVLAQDIDPITIQADIRCTCYEENHDSRPYLRGMLRYHDYVPPVVNVPPGRNLLGP